MFLKELIRNMFQEDPFFNNKTVLYVDNANIHWSEEIIDFLN